MFDIDLTLSVERIRGLALRHAALKRQNIARFSAFAYLNHEFGFDIRTLSYDPSLLKPFLTGVAEELERDIERLLTSRT